MTFLRLQVAGLSVPIGGMDLRAGRSCRQRGWVCRPVHFRKDRALSSSSHPYRRQRPPQISRTCFEGPFGELLRATGPMAKTNPFRFSTKFQDDEADLLCYRDRYYSTTGGRWLSRDPIGETSGINLYAAWRNQPSNRNGALGVTVTKPKANHEAVRWEHGGGRVQIPRCTYLIIAAHGRAAPSELYVENKDKGCAFGAVYGCLTGGGEYINPAPEESQTLPPVVIMPPVPSPGIPGGPAQPGGPVDGEDDCIDGTELSRLVHEATEAAKTAVKAGALCGPPCCCTTVTVWVHIIGSRGGFPEDVKEELYMRGCR